MNTILSGLAAWLKAAPIRFAKRPSVGRRFEAVEVSVDEALSPLGRHPVGLGCPGDGQPVEQCHERGGVILGEIRVPLPEQSCEAFFHKAPGCLMGGGNGAAGCRLRGVVEPNDRSGAGFDDDAADPAPVAIVASAITCLDVAGELWVDGGGTEDLRQS